MKISNPYDPHRVDISLFYGRDQLLLDLSSDVNAGRSCAIVGGRRIGKSTLLRKLENSLTEQLPTSAHSGFVVIPVYVDILSITSGQSPRPVYAAILSGVFAGLARLKLIGHEHRDDMTLLAQSPGEESRIFKEVLVRWLAVVSQVCFVRIAVLFDEVEPITRSEWGNGFFSNWRSLLNNSPEIYHNICAVFAGAKEMNALCEDVGSPLANILVWRTLSLFHWIDTYHLIQEPAGRRMSDRLARKIFVVTGGHPFLIQFLMQRICGQSRICTEEVVDDAARYFLSSHTQVFANWVSNFEEADRTAYVFLARKVRPQAKRDLVQLLGDTAANDALSLLCHTGVATKGRKHSEHYRARGTLFRDWFMRGPQQGSGETVIPTAAIPAAQNITIKEFYMSGSSKYQVRDNTNVVGVGDNVRVENFAMTNQEGGTEQINMDSLIWALATLQREAAKRATTVGEKEAVRQIGLAETSAQKGDKTQLIGHLKLAGVWIAGIAKELGTSVVAKIIEGQLGLV
jgi:hypothetical protein